MKNSTLPFEFELLLAGLGLEFIRFNTRRKIDTLWTSVKCPLYGNVKRSAVAPAELIALKVIGMIERPNTPKGLTDQADLFRLLLRFPDLKAVASEVQTALEQFNASPDAHQTWKQLVEQEIITDDDDAY